MHRSNYDLSKGTPKATPFIPLYDGFIPVNRHVPAFDRTKVPYFAQNKTNHMANYHIRLPDYQGFIPKNPANIKGNPRPFCLKTEGETFC